MSEEMATSSVEQNKYRSYLSGEEVKNIKWRFGGPPDYSIWPPGSLEEKVQNLVKTWEMEFFHKTSLDDFKTMDPKKYTLSLNGRKAINLEEIGKLGGGYNPLLQTSLPEKFRSYNPDKETSESSHRAFTTTFPRGFALEVLQVYSGPPVIVYKFRHWGYMEGPFKGHAPTGDIVEFYGMAIFEVDEQMKVIKVEFFYDPGELLGGLLKGASLDGSAEELGTGCPVLRNTG
ncbi:Pathogen-related protein [Morella rubra]|uniref:Pathogen-related protein n=1 Tax=Morella rubra TaxID=262757 RepID=A0A6A1W6T7_9ROSI|nr:Pathogen-related protein [Morella rubra]